MHRYELEETIIYGEDGKQFTVYGIKAIDENGKVIKSYPDVFFDKCKAEALVEACNVGELSIVHLKDVVEDALVAQYTL